MKFHNITKILALIFSLLGVAFVLIILSENYFGIDLVLYTAYIVLTSIITSVLYFGVKSVVSDKTSLIRTLKSVGSFLGLFIICYVLSSGNETPMRDGKTLSANGSKLIGAALFMFYSLILIASSSMLFFAFKNRKK
jgi:NADH:ubiquinone oxidoreductase subunit 6 (subunit J)